MKICFICSEYPPGPHGGLGSFTQVLARGLVRAGHQVRVIGLYAPSYPGEAYHEDQGVQVWRLRQPTFRFGWILGRHRLFRVIAEWARKKEIDLVEVPDWEAPAAGWPRLPIPVVARLNGSATYFAAELGRPIRRRTSWLERASLRRADAWCSASRHTADKTRQLFRMEMGPCSILPNPVELPEEGGDTPRSQEQVVFTGTLIEKKGVVSLIHAWPRVVTQCRGAQLHIFGKDGVAPDGTSMRAYLRAQLGNAIEGTVRFHGHVDREVLFGMLRHAAVAVFPSYSEAFGIAPVEAMAHACPTIYTRREPGPELVRHGVDGLLIEPDNPVDIAEAIIRVLGDPDLGRRLGQAGRERVKDAFSIDVVLRLNEAFYQSCLATFRAAVPSGEVPFVLRRPVASAVAADRVPEMPQVHTRQDANARPDAPSAGEAGMSRDVSVSLRLGRDGVQRPVAPGPADALTRGVTVVICTYLRDVSLTRFLDSLVAQERMPDRLIVVDASPDDRTERAVRSHRALAATPCDVLYFRVTGSLRGLTRQRNFALRWVATDLIAYFDDDVVLQPGCCRELESHHRDQGPSVVGIGALIENELGPPRLMWRLRAWLGIVPTLRPGAYTRSGHSIPWSFLSATEERLVGGDWLPGGAAMWRTAPVREVGFSEHFGEYVYGEDLDFSLRMRAKGALAIAGRARVFHYPDVGGRPTAYETGYASLRHWYDIHRRCLPNRTRADGAYFIYAYCVDVLVQSLGMLKGRHLQIRWQFLRGRVRFLIELILGRHGVGAFTESKRG